MNTTTSLVAAAVIVFATGQVFADGAALTPAEKTAGWKTIFDGSSTSGWKGFKKDAFPAKGWIIEDGAIKCVKGGGGGDIVSTDDYGDFELSLEFKCSPGANSGIMYRVSDKFDAPWRTGPEYQILDDALHPDGKLPSHRVGSLYDMIAAPDDKPAAKPNEWNTARIRLSNGLLQHFLNGKKVVECRVDGQDWKDRIAKSKFKDMKGFGLESKGKIVLQDHGDDVWYRNIRIRDLKAPMPGEEMLFNGKDMKGWTWFTKDGGPDAKIEETWTVQDGGILSDKGSPNGYIATTKDYTNFVLRVSWKWEAPPAKPGNSGVLFRVQKPDNVWPKSIEGQLMNGRAGDFYSIGEFPMKGDPARMKGRHTAHVRPNERPQGEWNEYEIIVDGESITLVVNGEELNKATGCAVLPGRIALQSEGAQLYFKDVRLAEIK